MTTTSYERSNGWRGAPAQGPTETPADLGSENTWVVPEAPEPPEEQSGQNSGGEVTADGEQSAREDEDGREVLGQVPVTGSVLGEPAGAVTSGKEVALRGDVVAAVPVTVSRQSTLQKLLRRIGIGSAPPEADELYEEDFATRIRQATWTRSVNVAVLQRAGGDGCTPTALMLGHTLGHVRGGATAVVEATLTPGALSRVAEGQQRRGLAELLQATDRIESAGQVAGYSAPQTSHAAVFGTVGARPELTADDVVAVRRVLDRYYHLTVTDADHNVQAAATRKVIETADAVVIPCVRHPQSVQDTLLTFEEVARLRPDLASAPGGQPRITIQVGQDSRTVGADGDQPSAADLLREHLPAGAASVHEVPFEQVLKNGAEITYADCAPATQRAWLRVTAAVVTSLLDAPEESLIP